MGIKKKAICFVKACKEIILVHCVITSNIVLSIIFYLRIVVTPLGSSNLSGTLYENRISTLFSLSPCVLNIYICKTYAY